MKLFIIMLVTHWVSDFILQTDEMAKGKRKDWGCLLRHTVLYSMIWLLVGFFMTPNLYGSGALEVGDWMCKVSMFVFITFITHTFVDYFTSRINYRLKVKNDMHNMFVVIGFDQMLHYLQLYFTYKIIFE